ncbi:hypothetical protein D035_0509 [Vibrio parahaemolyticus VP250]|nr:hypothetical protein D035_0509 [Vibrio parahaemolyticus VP250]
MIKYSVKEEVDVQNAVIKPDVALFRVVGKFVFDSHSFCCSSQK